MNIELIKYNSQFTVVARAVFAGVALLGGAFIGASTAQATDITFLNSQVDFGGAGHGKLKEILVLQQPGGGDTEYGSVIWDGTDDVLTGDTKVQTQTRTAGGIASDGGIADIPIGEDNFYVVLNLNDNNLGQMTIFDFSLRFFNPSGGMLFADATYTAPVGGLVLNVAGNGQGSLGWLFKVNFTDGDGATFFANPDNRVGGLVAPENAWQNAAAGSDNLSLVGTPEPSTLLALLLGGVMLVIRRRR